MNIQTASQQELLRLESDLSREYEEIKKAKLNLDITRGKPSAEQTDIAKALDGILHGKYSSADGTDTRNYGLLDGLPEAKELFAPILGVKSSEILVGGNSSLNLMYYYVLTAYLYGVRGPETAWNKEKGKVKFLCPVPGYDRHFAICEDFGIEMIPVPFRDNGPDMDIIEQAIQSDPLIRGIWCVPKYSNPTGHVYSEHVVERMAKLGKIAHPSFRIMWDNAYAMHDFGVKPKTLANIFEFARKFGTEDSIIIFGSTSKITFAGAGVAFLGASEANLKELKKRMAITTIGPDKANQLRHVVFMKDQVNMNTIMGEHAKILKPKFDAVQKRLSERLEGTGLANWTVPEGGYFVSLDTLPGHAKEVVRLAGEAGVKLTPAGSTYPLMKDPEDRNIRVAPSFPTLEAVDRASQVLALCVQLASVRKKLQNSDSTGASVSVACAR